MASLNVLSTLAPEWRWSAERACMRMRGFGSLRAVARSKSSASGSLLLPSVEMARSRTRSLGFPFWHPEPERRGFFQISSQKAFDAGWKQRPFNETALEYLWYLDQLDPNVWQWTDELSAQVEARALEAWLDAQRTSRTGG